METATGENGPDPDLVAALWDKAEKHRNARAALRETEGELIILLTQLERLNTPIVEILKICNEPLLVSMALFSGRFSPEQNENPRSFSEIYSRTCEISEQIKRDKKGKV